MAVDGPGSPGAGVLVLVLSVRVLVLCAQCVGAGARCSVCGCWCSVLSVRTAAPTRPGPTSSSSRLL